MKLQLFAMLIAIGTWTGAAMAEQTPAAPDVSGHVVRARTAPGKVAAKQANRKAEGRVRRARPYLGVNFDMRRKHEGVVTKVERRSPAEQQGLQVGDTIVSVDGDHVRTPYDVRDILSAKQSGSEVTLNVERDGEPLEVKVVLGSK